MGLPKTALKAFLLIINVLLFIAGAIIMGIGIWAVADKSYVSDLLDNNLYWSASVMMVVIGVFLILVAFLGCGGAIGASRIITIVYVLAIVVILILLLSAAIVAAVFHGEIEDKLKENMRTSLVTRYGVSTAYNEDNARLTKAWDLLQTKLKCCAIEDNGWYIYQQAYWFTSKYGAGGNVNPYYNQGGYNYNQPNYNQPSYNQPNYNTGNNYNPGYNVGYNQYGSSGKTYVPESCCVYEGRLKNYVNLKNCQSFQYGPPVQNNGAQNNALHYQGCYNAFKDFAYEQANIFVGIGFSFLVFLITAIIVGVLYFSALGNSSGEYLSRPYHGED